jgi:hypothetical protein
VLVRAQLAPLGLATSGRKKKFDGVKLPGPDASPDDCAGKISANATHAATADMAIKYRTRMFYLGAAKS